MWDVKKRAGRVGHMWGGGMCRGGEDKGRGGMGPRSDPLTTPSERTYVPPFYPHSIAQLGPIHHASHHHPSQCASPVSHTYNYICIYIYKYIYLAATELAPIMPSRSLMPARWSMRNCCITLSMPEVGSRCSVVIPDGESQEKREEKVSTLPQRPQRPSVLMPERV